MAGWRRTAQQLIHPSTLDRRSDCVRRRVYARSRWQRREPRTHDSQVSVKLLHRVLSAPQNSHAGLTAVCDYVTTEGYTVDCQVCSPTPSEALPSPSSPRAHPPKLPPLTCRIITPWAPSHPRGACVLPCRAGARRLSQARILAGV